MEWKILKISCKSLIGEGSCVKREGFNRGELTLLSHSELGSESISRRKLTVLAGKILKQVQDDSYDNTHNEPLTPHSSHLTNGAGQRASLFDWMAHGQVAFTMAEILLSLTIIGVVAAITLPSLTGNINERTWNTQRKALYSRISQAISLMPALNGYGTLDDTTDTAAETFVTSGLAKVLKINNICTSNFADCGIVSSYANMVGTKSTIPQTLYELNAGFSHTEYEGKSYSTKNANAVAFETQNGESIVAYYNQTCRTEYLNQDVLTAYGNYFGFPHSNMCVNFIYDLNGKKGPNTFGKDIGIITVFNATDSTVVAPMPSATVNATYEGSVTMTWHNASKACTAQNPESRVPNINELSAMYINKNIIYLPMTGNLWSSSVYDTRLAWVVTMSSNIRATLNKNDSIDNVRCVLR